MLGKAVESLSPWLRAGHPKNHGSNPGRDSSLLKNVQAVYGTYPASYSLGTGCSFLRRTVTKTWRTMLTPIHCQVKSELCLSSAYIYTFTTWMGILYLPTSKQNEGEAWNKAAASGWRHTNWKRKLHIVRKNLCCCRSTRYEKSKTLERFVQERWLARAKRMKYTVNGRVLS